MDTAGHTTLLVELVGGVCTLTLNRPEVRNAMSLCIVQELMAALAQAQANPAVRVLVLRGSGGHFCAGGDIADMAQARMKLERMAPERVERPREATQQSEAAEVPVDPVADFNAQFGRLCLAYARTPLPLITVLEGTVMGGGFGLACVSDVSLALPSTVFRLPETALGVIPAQIAPFLVERLGYAEAKRLAVTGAKVDAAQALAIRLVHEVWPDPTQLEAALQRTVNNILACAPGAIGITKGLLARTRSESPERLIDEAAALFSQAVLGEEGQEGTRAFMQKRKPSWVPTEA